MTHIEEFKYQDDKHTVGDNVTMFAFIWTYPMINNIVVSYTASSHWVYDLMAIMHGNAAQEIIRRQMKVFVVAIVIFVIILYLVYMLSLPANGDIEYLDSVFFYLAIFEWLCAAIITISIFLYIKRITMNNRLYGKIVLMEAVVFSFANIISGIFNYYMSKGYIGTLLTDRDYDHPGLYSGIVIPLFIVTEFIPSIAFGKTMQVLAKVLNGEINEQAEQQGIQE